MTASARPKRAAKITAEEAAALVKSDTWIDYGAMFGQPDLFDKALAARKSELRNVKVRACLSVAPRAIVECDDTGEHFQFFNWHFSGYDRRKHDEGRCNYIPMNFGESLDYYRRFIDPPEIAILKVCPADKNGNFNMSGNCTYQPAVVDRAKTLIVEVCDTLPYIPGADNFISRDRVDYIIEGNHAPVPQLMNPAPTEIDQKIAKRIAERIEDGACLQIGIGAMPNAVCTMLKESGVRDLGIHTEMMIDGMVDLHEAGLVTGARKQINRGKMVFTFALGSQRLYDFLDHNDEVETHPVDYTNLPTNIMKNDRVVSINSTTQIDLQGQAASESSGHRHISGTGGQLQFVRGAYASKDGESFLCLSSTYEKRGGRQSRIVPSLTPGNVVTTPRTDVMYVVTEYGIANLKGKSVAERAAALIGIAHPDFREELAREARNHNIIPKGFVF